METVQDFQTNPEFDDILYRREEQIKQDRPADYR
jgi:hypothetical protein